MSTGGSNTTFRLELSRDATEAELVVPADMPEADVNVEAACALLFEAGVTIEDSVREAVEVVIGEWSSGVESRGVVARGRPAKHGAHGRVEWDASVLSESEREELAECSSDGASGEPQCRVTPSAAPAEVEQARVSFYDRCAFVMVTKGQQLGRVVPPEEGIDGVDVTGKSLPAKDGRAAKLKVDDSILIDAAGSIISQEDGVLSRSLERAAVRNFLDIPDAVDFSTGNIEFDGDVRIANGVRDLFEVSATGNLDVRGLIESAVIVTDGDVVSAGGMAGRERGKLRAGGDLTIRYIDSAEVNVGGDLHIEREIINCDVLVMGQVRSPRAAVIGGRLVSIGPIEVGTLGSDGATPTDVVVGSVPPLEERLTKLDALITKLEKQHETESAEMQTFSLPGRVRTSEDAERQTELSFGLMQLQDKLTACRATRKAVVDKINGLRVVDLRVQKTLHMGVAVCCGMQRVTLTRDLKGPVRIVRDRRGELCYRTGDGGSNTPLRQIGDVQAAAA